MKLVLNILEDHYAVCKLEQSSETSEWIKKSEFISITKAHDESSVVCRQSLLPSALTNVNKDWRILKICGPLDFSLVGIIAHISGILKDAAIPIFTISTYLTDYILVKNDHLEKATLALRSAGHRVT